jgi:hypothetical protein
MPALNTIELEQGNNSLVSMRFEVDIPANAAAGDYTTNVLINGVVG